MKKLYLKIAGCINLFTAVLHLIAGQVDLVNPLMNSNLALQEKGEITSAWHIVTILLFFTSYIILRHAFSNENGRSIQQLKDLAFLYLLCGLPFIIISLILGIFAPQWILLMPIGVLILLEVRKEKASQFRLQETK